MTDWVLVPCLVQLRAELNRIAPGRSKRSSGSVADAAHRAGGTSDHIPDEEAAALRGRDADRVNEVHAIDEDKDLRVPGLSMEKVVQFLLARCRSGAEKRLRYIIFSRRIWEASNGWRQRTYKGSNPHAEHAHFSATYDTAGEASMASWHLADLMEDDVQQADIDKIVDAVADRVLAAFKLAPYGDKLKGEGSPAGRAMLNAGYPARPGAERTATWANLQEIQTSLDEVRERLSALAPPEAVKTAK